MLFILHPPLFQLEKHSQRLPNMKLPWILLKPVPPGLWWGPGSLPCASQDAVFPLLVDSTNSAGRFPHNSNEASGSLPMMTLSPWKPPCVSLSSFHLKLWTSLINPQSFSWPWEGKIIQGSRSLVPCCLLKPGDNHLKMEPRKYSPARTRLSCLVV